MTYTEDILSNLEQPIILVGSGKQKRHDIDSYETIIRFNNFKIIDDENAHNYVGTKTTHWLVNGNSFIRKACDLQPISTHTYEYYSEQARKYFRQNVGIDPIYAKDNWIKRAGFPHPRLGFMTCLILLDKNYNFSIIGFSREQDHYWEQWEGAHGHNDYLDYELTLLEKSNKIKLI